MISIGHFVAQHPHGNRLRKRRDRRLGAIRADRSVAIRYAVALTHHVVAPMRAAGLEIAEALRPRWPAVHDAKPPTVKHEVDRVRTKTVPRTKAIAPKLAEQVVTQSANAVDTKLAARINMSMAVQLRQAFLVSKTAIADDMVDALHQNIDLITSISDDYFDEVENVISDNWENVGDWSEAVEAIEHVGEVTQSRAELIARDQTYKLNSRFNQARQQSLGVTRYIWTTVGDDRVREAHAELDGQTFDWDDPPTDSDGNTGAPGDCGVNCRCAADPVLDLDEDEDQDAGGDEDADEEEDEAGVEG